MAQCKDCIHEKVCLHKANIETDTYAYMGIKYDTEKCKHYTSADVVPKSEVETLRQDIERIIDEGEYWQGKFLVAKQAVAREIFEEIDGITDLFAKGLIGELEMYDKLTELKKKRTESEDKE